MSPRFHPRFQRHKFFLTNWIISTRMFRVTGAEDQASQGQPRLNYGWISQCVPEVFPYLISRFRSLIKLRGIAQLFANRLRRPLYNHRCCPCSDVRPRPLRDKLRSGTCRLSVQNILSEELFQFIHLFLFSSIIPGVNLQVIPEITAIFPF